MDHTDKSNDYCRNFHYATVQNIHQRTRHIGSSSIVM